MLRHRVLISTICFLVVASLSAQQSDEVKQKPLEIRKADAPDSPSPTPSKSPSPKKKKKTSPTPTPTAKSKSHASPKETPEEDSPTPSASPRKKKSADDEETPKPKKSPSPKSKSKSAKKKSSPAKKKTAAEEEDETPVAKKKHLPSPSETPLPKASASAPRAVAVPSASAAPTERSTSAFESSPAAAEEPEQLTIEKYGYDKPKSFWQRLFGGGGRSASSGAGYRYLTASVRAAIDRVSPDRRNPRWQLIVVHNSGTRQGNARVFDYYHKHVRHMQNGLAYHFVIGNGTSTGNGQIEIGDRWRRQINGGHVHSDYLNNIAIGICLVGDFNRDQPTRAQLDCCEELVRYLRQRCGKIDNHFPLVRPHREVNPPRWATDCPGDRFPYAWFRRF